LRIWECNNSFVNIKDPQMKMFDRFRRSPASGDTESQQEIAVEGDSSSLTDLSWEMRIYCFGGCLILSLMTSILGSPFVFVGKWAEFAVMTSLGAVISIIGTFFLSNPISQLKKMFEPKRLIATIVYLTSIAFALICGLVLKNPILAIVCVVIEYIAMVIIKN